MRGHALPVRADGPEGDAEPKSGRRGHEESQANLAAIGRAFASAGKKIVPETLGDTIATFDETAKGETFVNPLGGRSVPTGLEWTKLPAWVNQHSDYVYLPPPKDKPEALTEPQRILAHEKLVEGVPG